MRLYFFRTSNDIPIEDVQSVAERVGQVIGIDYSIFSVTANLETSIKELLHISDQFLERGEPVTAIAFTCAEGVLHDEAILGEASEQSRGAWVKWSGDLQQTVIVTLHEFGHICGANHCGNQNCVMYPVYREHLGRSLSEFFCQKCLTTIQISWVYTRLMASYKNRVERKTILPKIVGLVTQPRQVSTHSSYQPFPDWSLAYDDQEEFVRRVLEHFGLRRKRF
jgi:hypothetical protein